MSATFSRLLLVLVLSISASAYAQNNRSAVSLYGTDSNPCTVPQPCRTFAAAIALTNSGGDVIALDSGGYGPFTITRAVTVQPVPGAYAGIAPVAGDAITINAPAGEAVVIRGLNLAGLGGFNGILFLSGLSLHVENCSINRFSAAAGINFSASVSSKLYVNNTSIRNSSAGIYMEVYLPVVVHAVIEKCRLEQNGEGLLLFGNSLATVHDSVVAGNTTRGMRASGAGAELNIGSCVVANNASGLHVNSNAIMRVTDTLITNNGVGVTNIAGTLFTRQDNTLAGNSTNQSGTSTPLTAW